MGTVLKFGGFTVEADRRALAYNGARLTVTPKEFDLLLYLVRAPGRVVTKDELIYGIWPNEGISDANLAQVVYRLRKNLGMHETGREFIATVPGQGYQFTEPVFGAPGGIGGAASVPDRAFQLYRNGRYLLALRTGPSMARSITMFEEALNIEPRYALAHVSVAEAYAFLGEYLYLAPVLAFPKAKTAALQALEIDPQCAEAHAVLGEVLMYYERDWHAADQAYKMALSLAPYSVTARLLSSWHALFTGKFESALDNVKTALAVDPASVLLNTTLGVMQYYARDFSGAQRQLDDVLWLDPYSALARIYHAMLHATLGNYEIAAASVFDAGSGEYELQSAGLRGYCAARSGDGDLARRQLAFLEDPGEGRVTSHMNQAFVHVGLERFDDALAALELAFQDSDPWLPFLAVHPLLDPLRNGARFRTLSQRVAGTVR